jgi:LmbE family N-acetylglucosaminyl deacetylase
VPWRANGLEGNVEIMPDSRQVVLTLLAHPDDAEILCGGTLALLRQRGWEVHIATATPGDCGTMSQTRWDISSIRTNEAKRAAAMIEATYHCLDERDGMVIYDQPALRKAIELFRRVAPTLVFTHPVKDYMLDHEQTHLLARGASFIYGAPNISATPLAAGSRIPHLYYCDPIDGIDPLGVEVKPTTSIDIGGVIARKAEMLACHASQREWLRAHHGMDEYIEAMKRHGRHRGQQAGAEYAEAFVQHRGHAYPQEDLLAKLFGKEQR